MELNSYIYISVSKTPNGFIVSYSLPENFHLWLTRDGTDDLRSLYCIWTFGCDNQKLKSRENPMWKKRAPSCISLYIYIYTFFLNRDVVFLRNNKRVLCFLYESVTVFFALKNTFWFAFRFEKRWIMATGRMFADGTDISASYALRTMYACSL